jgi:DNA-binding CsgD family transcriptional regulator/tetratricopeptide (TPR) repeat protein
MDARRALAQSRGSVVLVGGEAGIGKSRLLAQFLASVTRDSRPRFTGSAECLERSDLPFGPFRRLLATLRIPFPAAPQHDRAEIFVAIAAALREAASKRTTILTLEDLHWADPSSLELLAYLAPRVAGSRLLLVATYRTEDVETDPGFFALLSRLGRESTVARIALEPFGDTETRELLAGAMRERQLLPERIRDDVVRRSEGNPFFAEELLKDALDRTTSGRAQLPISIRATISDRLGVLSPEERRVLSNAAVLGYRFDPELLARTMETSVDELLPALLRGRDLNIVVEEEDARGRFRFRHALTRQAVYEAMLAFDARRVHARILRTLEAFGEEARHIDALAYHAWEARDPERTVRYNEGAGLAALELRALQEARACFERALGAASDRGAEARLLSRIGYVAEWQGALTEAVDRFTSALAIYKELEQFDDAAEMVRAIATNRNNLDDAGSIAFGTAFLEEFGSRTSPGEQDVSLALLARLASIQIRPELAEEFLSRIEQPERLPPRARQNYLITRLDAYYFAGDVAGWRALAPQLFETIELLPPFTAITAIYALGQSAVDLGCNDIAKRAFARVDAIEERWQFSALRTFGIALRAHRAWLLGDVAGAREHILAGLAGSEAAVARLALAVVAPHVSVATGDPALVPPAMEADFEACRRGNGTLDDGQILMAAAAFGFAHGRTESARSDLRRALAMLPRAFVWTGPLLALAAAHLPSAECERLRELTEPEQFFAEDRAGFSGASLARAILERRFGTGDAATELARTAASGYRAIGWPLFEAHALEVAGDKEAARSLYARCGATALAGPQDPSENARFGLSERELAVAYMIADGATNAAIGESLAVGTKTVEKYVAVIFRKLSVAKRAQIAALIAREE